MSKKTTGIEFKKFYNDSTYWPVGSYHDDTEILVNGVEWEDAYEEIPDIATVTIHGGMLYENEGTNEGIPFESFFRKWRKQQKVTVLVIEVPNDKLEEVLRRLTESQIKVLV